MKSIGLFQSPQWGSNSKDTALILQLNVGTFQSPQWGSNSKANTNERIITLSDFSPRNGEAILKYQPMSVEYKEVSFSPRNGEAILKALVSSLVN